MKNNDKEVNSYQNKSVLADFREELFNFQQCLINLIMTKTKQEFSQIGNAHRIMPFFDIIGNHILRLKNAYIV